MIINYMLLCDISRYRPTRFSR